MRGVKGQFYFIAAIIVVLAVIGFVTIANFSKTTHDRELSELKQELDIEIEYLFEYLTYNPSVIPSTIYEDFIDNYVEEIGNRNIIFIYGTQGDMRIRGYKYYESYLSYSADDNEGIQFSGTPQSINQGTSASTSITINYNGNDYKFDLKEGQNFYYLITKEYKGEKQIIKG
ncbi:MAG: hypothetical protein KC516_00945 [Nanoarchaeota archaeon]|nr:hypothetical protein [Nanoarchaeota archaeon]